MQNPSPPLLTALQAVKAARAITPTNQPLPVFEYRGVRYICKRTMQEDIDRERRAHALDLRYGCAGVGL